MANRSTLDGAPERAHPEKVGLNQARLNAGPEIGSGVALHTEQGWHTNPAPPRHGAEVPDGE